MTDVQPAPQVTQDLAARGKPSRFARLLPSILGIALGGLLVLFLLPGRLYLATPAVINAGEVKVGDKLDMVVTVWNPSPWKCEILGASKDCTCTTNDELPATVGPFASKTLTFKTSTDKPGDAAPFTRRIQLLTDSRLSPRITVDLAATGIIKRTLFRVC
jgi:hypothetical protein